MTQWQCPVCGYIHEGDTPPKTCPKCEVPGSSFQKIEEQNSDYWPEDEDKKSTSEQHSSTKRLGDIAFISYICNIRLQFVCITANTLLTH